MLKQPPFARESGFILWAERLALVAVPLAICAILVARSGRVEPTYAVVVLVVAALLAMLALAVLGVGAIDMWRHGRIGLFRLFRTLAGLAPAFGLLATLIGLIGMMTQLGTATIAQVGEHMSVALVATLYGVVLANLVFKPIAIKLEQRTARRAAMLNVLLEGVLLLRLGRSPTVIADALAEFIRDSRDELHGAA